MTPSDASNHPDKVIFIKELASQIINFSELSCTQSKLKVIDHVRNADKRNIFSKDVHLFGIENYLKLTKF